MRLVFPTLMLTALAFLGGMRLMQQMDRRFPHAHVEHVEANSALPQVELVVAAIALHKVNCTP